MRRVHPRAPLERGDGPADAPLCRRRRRHRCVRRRLRLPGLGAHRAVPGRRRPGVAGVGHAAACLPRRAVRRAGRRRLVRHDRRRPDRCCYARSTSTTGPSRRHVGGGAEPAGAGAAHRPGRVSGQGEARVEGWGGRLRAQPRVAPCMLARCRQPCSRGSKSPSSTATTCRCPASARRRCITPWRRAICHGGRRAATRGHMATNSAPRRPGRHRDARARRRAHGLRVPRLRLRDTRDLGRRPRGPPRRPDAAGPQSATEDGA